MPFVTRAKISPEEDAAPALERHASNENPRSNVRHRSEYVVMGGREGGEGHPLYCTPRAGSRFLVGLTAPQYLALPTPNDFDSLAHAATADARRRSLRLDERAVLVPSSELALTRLVSPSGKADDEEFAEDEKKESDAKHERLTPSDDSLPILGTPELARRQSVRPSAGAHGIAYQVRGSGLRSRAW
jgi:hypothetical protein